MSGHLNLHRIFPPLLDINKSAHRLFEALLTCCLTSPLCKYFYCIQRIVFIPNTFPTYFFTAHICGLKSQ